ncbi:MAG: hypothetical protein M3O87_08210 [Candidatus Dormibacteraeota bacterium]|nr:hypothetical protein [Candidatus Dormibacteraeota bacterium]
MPLNDSNLVPLTERSGVVVDNPADTSPPLVAAGAAAPAAGAAVAADTAAGEGAGVTAPAPEAEEEAPAPADPHPLGTKYLSPTGWHGKDNYVCPAQGCGFATLDGDGAVELHILDNMTSPAGDPLGHHLKEA